MLFACIDVDATCKLLIKENCIYSRLCAMSLVLCLKQKNILKILFLRNSHNYAYVEYCTLLIYINSLACALISIIVCVYVFSTLHMKEGLSDCCSSYPCSPHSAVFRHWSLLLLCSLLTGGTTHYCQVLLSESNNMEGSGLFYG